MDFRRSVFSKLTKTGFWVLALCAVSIVGQRVQASDISGENLFKQHCTSCHAEGGNIIKPDKTLSRKDREKHGVKSSKDIIKLMRKPGVGMTVFDRKDVSDKEAKAIADYVVKTFR